MKTAFILLLLLISATPIRANDSALALHTRSRVESEKNRGDWQAIEKTVEWDPKKTAIVICDMWDQHWCKGATERVAEMAPRMNQVVQEARRRGIFIIHAPSSTMEFYKDTPQRKRAQAAPQAEPKVPLQRWCSLDPSREAPLPIDDSDGGCDDVPQCKQGSPWRRQIATIEIAEEDAITDSDEAYNLLQQRGIDNVIVMGVHVNMCVLGRPFSIRQMVYQGKNVVLMRDMTDAMYNSRRRPFVSHFRGNDLVIEHIEKYWCPSITSVDFLGGKPFRFKADERRRVALVIGENEYQTWETLPEFAKNELEPRGFECSYVLAPPKGGNDFGNYGVIRDADLLLISVRRRTPQTAMLDAVRDHITAGKPVVGIRTASHAFDAKAPDEHHAAWPTFDRDVFGGDYRGHFNNKPPAAPPTMIRSLPEAAKHPVMTGIGQAKFEAVSTLYKNPNPASHITPLMTGEVEAQTHPVAWVNTAHNRRVFYTSLGHPADFEIPAFRRLLLNGILWALELPVPPDDTSKRSGDESAGSRNPEDALPHFRVAEDLVLDQLLAEPIVKQPVFLNFDERGRMWVVQYLQYPHPAGLTMLSRDNFWRAQYDKVPPPPPNHFRGADKITIHEDTDGDGDFDQHKTFVDGLNIATAVERGRGGVWVMNPPYLLFYPDRDNNDAPDGDPEVHLEGFGLEDTHSVANSLRWGPDGWLYAAQGSTVTGAIKRPGLDGDPVHSMGQLIWRYHPESRRYEIFAEGGGNAFGCEIDTVGRVFSGHNGGNTRGFHYQQGAYLQKGFEKHGPLSNPYAFGYFPPMPHPAVERFTHNFIIYDGGALPSRYAGKLFGVEPLQGRVVWSDINPDGSSFKTVDRGYALTSADPWFKPVDVKLGPDGAIYIADWYDRQVNHYRNHEGQIDTQNGRIYRLRAPEAKAAPRFDLARISSDALLAYLKHENKWFRQQALRVLGDRKDRAITPKLEQLINHHSGQPALEALWALNLSGGFDDRVALSTLRHANPFVRLWTVRLLGDDEQVTPEIALRLAELAATDSNLEVRGQLASTAKRLPATQALPIVRNLLARSEDATDNRLPLLIWWAIEAKAGNDRESLLAMFRDPNVWALPIVQEHIAPRLMRRYAAAGSRQDLITCARLLELAPDDEAAKRLLSGFEEAFKGRPLRNLPSELTEALARSNGDSIALGVRRGNSNAVQSALAVIQNRSAKLQNRLQYVQILGEVNAPGSVPSLLKLIGAGESGELERAALVALQRYDTPDIGAHVAQKFGTFDANAQMAALNLLAGRPGWARELIRAIQSNRIDETQIPQDIVYKLRRHSSDELASAVNEIWGKEKSPTTAEMQAAIDRLDEAIRAGLGNPYEGQKLFAGLCGACHQLFGQGGQIGPDLTTYRRDDLESMLLSVVHPNAEIREGYENYLITTKDDRAVSGFLVERDDNVVVVRGIDGINIPLPKGEIAEMKAAGLSLMPEGLLEGLNEQQVRDLFAYLRSTQPLPR